MGKSTYRQTIYSIPMIALKPVIVCVPLQCEQLYCAVRPGALPRNGNIKKGIYGMGHRVLGLTLFFSHLHRQHPQERFQRRPAFRHIHPQHILPPFPVAFRTHDRESHLIIGFFLRHHFHHVPLAG